jgi:MOSC domain-containing protein YiiM
VITAGVDLLKLVGEDFEIQGVRFRGTEHCRPCYWMNRAIAPGAEDFLKGRTGGGLRARILSDGIVRANGAC